MYQNNDMIVVLPPKNKTSQGGEKVEGEHIAANPFNPIICPVLALAKHVFSDGDREQYTDLFTRDSYDRFGRTMKEVVSSDEGQEKLQVTPDLIGMHSPRKGSSTHASAYPGGPSRDAICQRADWSLGGVRDRYIAMVNQGQDQFVARTLACLDLASTDFAVLQPHFSTGDMIEINSILRDVISVDAYPIGFRGCLSGLLASLAYHHEFLDSTMAAHDRLRNSRVWTSGIFSHFLFFVFPFRYFFIFSPP